ncbi:hypothetical protein ACPOL_1838 [Acidisarcina polymorpha]|uniref:Uncharacterized protein n=1 Tax=Acidisarcina polymorpha TaxID=2211140 RepID=A0A2Z5FWV1_9BACT|nr:hypothetical protein [Acidisarcina polymorpha]AXC11180.1 hypothetical protein ACPOL_1838 [Acidisarcina polymorpha]
MSRYKSYDHTTTTDKAKEMLAAVKAKLGRDLGMANVMANSPAVLESFLSCHHDIRRCEAYPEKGINHETSS